MKQQHYELPVELIHVQEWTPSEQLEPFHWHSNLEIGYCVSGKGWFYFGSKTYEVEAGDVFIVNNMEPHIAQSSASEPSRYLFLYFDPALVEDREKELLAPFVYQPQKFQNKIPAGAQGTVEIGALMHAIQRELRQRKSAYRSMARIDLLKICVLLLRHYGNETTSKKFNQAYNVYVKLQPALAFVKDNFREPIELADVAHHINLSVSRTGHLFKEALGKGYKEFLLSLRMTEAKKLLLQTELPVTDICLQCGYQSLTPFYRSFKLAVGLSPHEYRKQKSIRALLDDSYE
jgi:AraC-like DNA-binding protein/mannose-6-phosphate isomerase-like protein (cupin superfamily)